MEEKLLLVAINSKFSHSNLAVRYLKSYIESKSETLVDIYETTINNHLDEIIAYIYRLNIKNICFSVYIWNVEYVRKIVKELKKVMPGVKIILGGPEVSYKSFDIMRENSNIDYIVKGEGEKSLLSLIDYKKENYVNVVYRDGEEIIESKFETPLENLDEIPFPYTEEDLKVNLENRIIYYESSRGCPFDCSYCMSSIDKRVRYFSLERVKKDLSFFIKNEIKLIKFVDRTFNLKKDRYLEIWKYLLDEYTGKTAFHFEISADLFDGEVIEFLSKVPDGYFQFEIGVQTTNEKTLEAINRKSDIEKLFGNVKKIKNNIHLHLDLIAGLPYEDLEQFKNSFNMVYALKPEMLQLGFLKILKGTQISEEIEKFDYKYIEFSPYEVLKNKFITYDEMLELKNIEEVLEQYYNSSKFEKTMNYFEKRYNSAFELYEKLAKYWDKKGYFKIAHKRVSMYNHLNDFYKEEFDDNDGYFYNCLKYDYLSMGKPGNFPEWYQRKTDKELYNNEIKKLKFKTVRQGHNKTEFEIFDYDLDSGKKERNSKLFIYNYNGKNLTVREI